MIRRWKVRSLLGRGSSVFTPAYAMEIPDFATLSILPTISYLETSEQESEVLLPALDYVSTSEQNSAVLLPSLSYSFTAPA